MTDGPSRPAAPIHRPRAAFPPLRVAGYLIGSALILNFLLGWPWLAR